MDQTTPTTDTPQAKARVRRTADEMAKQIEADHAAKLAKLEKDRNDKLKKAMENAVPMAKRKAAAFEMVTNLRQKVRAANGNADLGSDEIDAKIASAIEAAFATG